MPFQYILANLLADTDNAVGVLFFDETGETVDLACSELTPYDLRVLGAYLGISIRQLGHTLADLGVGGSATLHVERDELYVLARELPEGYSLAIVLRPPVVVARVERGLAAAARQLEREVFALDGAGDRS